MWWGRREFSEASDLMPERMKYVICRCGGGLKKGGLRSQGGGYVLFEEGLMAAYMAGIGWDEVDRAL